MGTGGKGKRSAGKRGGDHEDGNDSDSSRRRDESKGHFKGKDKGKGKGHGKSKGKDGSAQQPRGYSSGIDDGKGSNTGKSGSSYDGGFGKGKPKGNKGKGGGAGGGRGPCKNWLAGSCSFGDQCWYEHAGHSSGGPSRGAGPSSSSFGGARPHGSAPSSSAGNRGVDAERFAVQVANARTCTDSAYTIKQNPELWMLAWERATAFKAATLEGFLKSLAGLPASADVQPPPLTACKNAAVQFCKNAGKTRPLDVADIVFNVVNSLTRFEWDGEGSQEDIRGSLQDMLDEVGKNLSLRVQEERNVRKKLESLVEELDKPWKIKLALLTKGRKPQQEAEEIGSGDDEEVPDHKLWRKATVGWLCKSELFCAPCLPRMKTPTTMSGGVYKTPKEYFETIEKLVVGMTFADGNAALMPRCSARTNAGQSCGATLCPLPREEGSACRVRNCHNPAEVACMNRFHKDGLCRRHAEELIACQLGPPGPKASTNIYDGYVAQVNMDGKVFIRGFASRAPPPHAIHWRSTRRLASPNLVGVVKLSSKGAPLKKGDPILWGEISFHSNPKDEDQERQRGKLAINMSSICDNFDPELLSPEDPVALIDCMTFVPEYVPVLKALEQQAEDKMPFEDGVLLNLHEKCVPDLSNTVSQDDLRNTNQLVQELIEESKLQPIMEIKRDPHLTEQLHRGLVRLVEETTLDRGQLVSFVDSLRNTVHLTQGPPGTGKSYLGVVIVRALILIRTLWIKRNFSVGTPPILVLSYKNHAIDEFLVDLTKSEHSVSRNLVRIGGGASMDPRLAQYSEKSFQRKDPEVERYRQSLQDLHTLTSSCKALANQAGLFLSKRMEMIQDLAAEKAGDDESRKRRKKNTYAAVEEVLVGMVRTSLIEKALSKLEKEDGASTYSGDYYDNDGDKEALLEDVAFLAESAGDPKCRHTRRRMSDEALLEMIPQLFDGFTHYIENNPDLEDAGEILCMFIEGKVPLPCCRYVGRYRCTNLSDEHDVDLCRMHRCNYVIDKVGQCREPRANDATYWCKHHRCEAADCLARRLSSEGQRFCYSHACFICVEKGLVAQQAENEPPRNTCKDHPLCIASDCILLAEPGKDYCAEHQKTPLMSLYSGAGRWARKGLALLKSEADDEEEDKEPVATERKTCEGKTKKGKPCRAIAARGKRCCDAHASQEPPPEPEMLPAAFAASSGFVEAKPGGPEEAAAPGDEGKMEKEKKDVEAKGASPAQNMPSPTTGVPDDSSPPALDDDAGSEASAFFEVIDQAKYDNQDEVEEADHLQHLREVFEQAEEESDDEDHRSSSSDEDAGGLAANPNDGDGVVEEGAARCRLPDPAEWTWELTLEERWEACQDFMYEQKKMLQRLHALLKEELPLARKRHHDAKVRANAKVYENKSVIGGTIVGCISRLQAIRSTKPFAILVEEASEVMEPLLFSCLCPTTVKFEMIGDHLQLQPSVMQRFDYQKINNINISMFERLIRAPPHHRVPSSVLTIQRRMRRDVCDLTRGYYKDIVAIEDHDVCWTKVIPGNTVGQSTWHGREVPGIQSHIYVWTHDGDQTKAHVGLSKMNQTEVDMSAWLAYYLVSCGVKRSSIAILTPYKGQLMAIRKVLQSDRSNTRLLAPYDTPDAEQVRLSTVDRFQGDEADIVIISLVVDQNSSTPFVKLVNRMIVLLSRARLGMYILGNSGYFDRPGGEVKHWNTTFEMLGKPAGSSDSADASIHLFDKPRLGRTLPMCCPIHPDSTAEAKKAKDLVLNFCKAKCEHALPCSHSCSLDCHWPSKTHRQTCETLVRSPCDRHTDELRCSAVYKHSPGSAACNIQQALLRYRCPEKVSLLLPCSHERSLPCHEERDITAGRQNWPECHQQSPVPYVHSECRHSLDVTCVELAKYRSNPSSVPRCKEEVDFVPSCGHRIRVKCYMKQSYEKAPHNFVCPQKINIDLPRCGHAATVSCSEEIRLREWSGRRCHEQGVVQEGVEYGPIDAPCSASVTFVLRCGHKVTKKCQEAFDAARVLSVCREKVKVKNPHCGHECAVACHERSKVEGFEQQGGILRSFIDLMIQPGMQPLVEGRVPVIPPQLHFVKCTHMVELQRRCGHIFKVQCHSAGAPLPPCKAICTIASPLCCHEMSVECCHQKDVESWQCWAPSTLSALQRQGKLSLAIPPVRRDLPDPVRNVVVSCKKELEVTKACGHQAKFKCQQLLKVVLNGGIDTKCNEKVQATLRCGHEVELLCSKYKSYVDGVEDVPCKTKDVKACWNVKNCGSNALLIPCGTKKQLCCDATTSWSCAKGHEYRLKLCQDGPPRGCPGCSLDDVKGALETNVAPLAPPTTLAPCFGCLRSRQIEKLACEEELSRFAEAKLVVLDAFYKQMSNMKDVWKTQPFQDQVFAILVPLTKKLKDKSGFTPLRDFVNQGIEGCIVTYRCTAQNCKALGQELSSDNSDDGHFLFGYVFTLKAKESASCPPANEGKAAKKEKQKRREEMHQAFRDNNDCIEMTSTRKRALLVREPFAVYATHRLTLTKSDLDKASSILDRNLAVPLPTGSPWTFEKPTGELLLLPARRKAAEEASASSAPEVVVAASSAAAAARVPLVPQPLPELRGTIAESLIFAFDPEWDYQKSLSISTTAAEAGAVGVSSVAVDHDLRQKLSFVNASASPFAGKNLLEELSRHQDAPFLQLLFGLELQSKDGELALQCLNSYWHSVDGLQAHPLILLAIHRLYRTAEALIALAHHFPLVTPLLTRAEQNAVEKNEATGDPEDDEGYGQEGAAAPRGSAKPQSIEPLDLWLELKETQGCESEAMEKLLALTGLRRVKQTAVQLFKSALRLSQMPEQARKANVMALNYCFLGNPGTGKTTVARLFAEILYEAGLRSDQTFTEFTSQQLKDEGVDEFRKKAKVALNGVIFIDEAYDLDPVGDKFKGAPIANELLTLAENERDKLTIILAGYEDDMNKKFFAYNDGLKSRFQEVIFEDFDAKELAKIWTDMREARLWREEDERLTSVLIKRLAKCAGRKGFGNAREVRRRLDQAATRAMNRPDFNGLDMSLTIADVIGEDPSGNDKLQDLQDEIESMTGWKAIKKAIKDLIEVSSTNYQRELSGQSPLPVFLNRLFLGNPGTGKTTCAKLYGQVLKHLGFLTAGDVVFKTAGDFGGAVVGEAPQKAVSILDGAKGKVLVIDEAYNLDDNLYGKQVLDVIVEKVQGSENDDIAVLMLGYEEPMLKMLRNQNPGLSRRFDPSQAFYFEDYNDNELLEILTDVCKRKQVKARVDFQEKALKKLNMLRRSEPNFGNAGSVNNLVKDAMLSASSRSPGAATIELLPCDVDIGGDRDGGSDEDPLAALEKLYRMEPVKQKIQEIRNAHIVAQREGGEAPELGHFVFTGAPGTGKTTVARTMAKILFDLKLIARNHVVETSGLNLTGEYSGQTKKKVEEQLDAAKGGVLFIDEAYELGVGHFGAEACTSIVAAMTSPTYEGLVIIIAGYPKEIGAMLDTNVGLKSRFTHYFRFPDWEPSDCCSLFKQLAAKRSMALPEDTLPVLENGFAALKTLGGWGNARDVDKLFKAAEQQRASRVVSAPEGERKLLVGDVKPAVDKMVQDRRSTGGGVPPSLTNRQAGWPMQAQADSQRPQAQRHGERQQEAECEQKPQEAEEGPHIAAGAGDGRDEGVSDDVWAALQVAKEQEKQREAARQRELEEKRLEEERLKKELEEMERLRLEAEERMRQEMERLRLEAEEKERQELMQRLEMEERERQAAIQRAKEEVERRLEAARRARLEAERRRQEELRKEQAIKEKLRRISPCPAGFNWFRSGAGWRCSGGSHFVSDAQLNSQFTS